MRINADFSIPAVIGTADMQWIGSPLAGVDRIMLDRIGDEVARATSIVRYAPESSFSRHEHAKGEEFLVLDGVFSDEHGDYGAGTYVRNPPGSGHTPFSKNGCRILVKLRQFDPLDLAQVVIDTNESGLWRRTASGDADVLLLHSFKTESVQMSRIPSGTEHLLPGDGCEVFVVSGTIIFDDRELPAGSWLRFPTLHEVELIVSSDVVLWTKHGHLPA